MTERRRRLGTGPTGPRTPAGKAIACQNARKHGLSTPVLAIADLAAEARQLAADLAGPGADGARLNLALAVAAATLQLRRVRAAAAAAAALAHAMPDLLNALSRLDRYHRRACSRRKFALRALDAAAPPPAEAADFGRTNSRRCRASRAGQSSGPVPTPAPHLIVASDGLGFHDKRQRLAKLDQPRLQQRRREVLGDIIRDLAAR